MVFLRTFVFLQSEIPSGSMENTILVGDYILVNRFLYAATMFDWERRLLPIRPIRRGDVVVFKYPPEPEQDFIKRVVGLPGESVSLRHGYLHVNGRAVEEPYVDKRYRLDESFEPLRLKRGNYFVLGDHRNRSSDSREWGTVPARLIKGRALLVLASSGAPRNPEEQAGQVSLKSLGRKLVHLVAQPRTERFFKLIR